MKINHPYYQFDIETLFKYNVYEKFIKNQKGGEKIGNGNYLLKHTYDIKKIKNGFFIGSGFPCLKVVFEPIKKAIIHEFIYRSDCDENKKFKKGNGPKDLMIETLKYLKGKKIKKVFLTDNAYVNCNGNKFDLSKYYLFSRGFTYYQQFKFIPKNEQTQHGIKIFIKQLEEPFNLSWIEDFINKNIFNKNLNNQLKNLCQNIENENIKKFINEISFIKDTHCLYFFSLIDFLFQKVIEENKMIGFTISHQEYFLDLQKWLNS